MFVVQVVLYVQTDLTVGSYFLFLFVQMQTAMKVLGRITKENSRGLDQTCPVLLGETTAAGQPTGSLLLSNLIVFPNSTVMYKPDMHR